MNVTIDSVIQYPTNYCIKYSDGSSAFIPLDPNNSDYAKVQQWIGNAHTVTPQPLPA